MSAEKLSDGGATQGRPEAASTGSGQPTPAQIKVDDSKAYACYTNFCRVTGTPEELIIDFGLNRVASQLVGLILCALFASSSMLRSLW